MVSFFARLRRILVKLWRSGDPPRPINYEFNLADYLDDLDAPFSKRIEPDSPFHHRRRDFEA